MSNRITVTFKDVTRPKEEFPPQQRAGGSFENKVRYEGAFAIVKDEYGSERAFPAEDIKEVTVVNYNR